jgi:hypothetical protein
MNLMNMWYSFFIFLTSGLSFPGSDSVDGLKKTADRDFLWLLVATGLVAIGLLFEVGEICQELKKWWKARGRKRSWVPVISAVGFLLVTIGVVGEGIFEGKLGIADTSIREKDEKTAQDAGDAAARAQQSAEAAVKDAVLANKEAGKAQQKTGDVEKQADKLNRELLAAKTQLATVDAKRAELEKSLIDLAVCNAPRVIPLWSMSGPGTVRKAAVDPLRPHTGWQFIIEYVPFDAEARRAAANVAEALEGAGWKMVKASQVDGIDDGVEVRAYFNRKAGPQEWSLHVKSQEAVYTLIDFLHSYNWEVKSGWAPDTDTDIPPNGIKIRVGLYPAVSYVSPPATKELAVVIAQLEKDKEKMRQQQEAERQKRDEKFLEHLTPEQRNSYRARVEEFRKPQEQMENRYRSVCQPLESLMPR